MAAVAVGAGDVTLRALRDECRVRDVAEGGLRRPMPPASCPSSVAPTRPRRLRLA